jgi:hypothetical protein
MNILVSNIAIKHFEEKKKILDRLNKVLEINEKNKIFFVCDIDEKKIKNIEELKNDVRKYFNIKTSRLFYQHVDKEYMSIIKIVYSNMNISLTHSYKTAEKNGIKKVYPCYKVG